MLFLLIQVPESSKDVKDLRLWKNSLNFPTLHASNINYLLGMEWPCMKTSCWFVNFTHLPEEGKIVVCKIVGKFPRLLSKTFYSSFYT